MLADKDMLEGKTAYVTHFTNPGIHELNLETKSYTRFINFTEYGCSGTYGIAYNSYNSYLYVECQKRYRSKSIIQVNLESNVKDESNFPGFPFVSPDGKYVVILYRSRNISRMNILAVNSPTSTEFYGELRIPGGVSHAVFYPKSENPGSYYVFVTLDYSNKMAVVDLDLAKGGNISAVTYIENVDELDSTPHGASRDIFISGKWIISPATKSKTVVIINAETQKVHGKVSEVNGGGFAVWVPAMGNGTSTPDSGISTPNSGTSTPDSGTSTPESGTSGIAGSSSLINFHIFLFGFLLFPI